MSHKRHKAFWAIVEQAIVGGSIAIVPVPGVGIQRQVALGINEISLCARIAQIYAERRVSEGEIVQMLGDAGIAVVSGSGLALAATKIGQLVIDDLLNWLPIVGWGIKGMLATSLTALVGCTFLGICELYFPPEVPTESAET